MRYYTNQIVKHIYYLPLILRTAVIGCGLLMFSLRSHAAPLGCVYYERICGHKPGRGTPLPSSSMKLRSVSVTTGPGRDSASMLRLDLSPPSGRLVPAVSGSFKRLLGSCIMRPGLMPDNAPVSRQEPAEAYRERSGCSAGLAHGPCIMV